MPSSRGSTARVSFPPRRGLTSRIPTSSSTISSRASSLPPSSTSRSAHARGRRARRNPTSPSASRRTAGPPASFWASASPGPGSSAPGAPYGGRRGRM
uniref:Uncharacterized protein n=1 Tax=Arundo donax TaxID=35708 RepID=A0A0A9DDI4_ARUDO